FKGHDMLAPFTAGWQTTDLHPLVIDKSEVPCLMRCACSRAHIELVKYDNHVQGACHPWTHNVIEHWLSGSYPDLTLQKQSSATFDLFTESLGLKVFFTNSGSEANDSQYLIFDRKCFLQVKLVWYYNNALGRPNKKKFIARSKAYVVSWINLNLCQSFWIAAFIAEPVMGAGGVIPPPKTYFEKVSLEVSLVPLSIQAVVKKYDILFIADELCLLAWLMDYNRCLPVQEVVTIDLISVVVVMISGVGAIFGLECEKRGMLIRVAGDNTMMSPPLIITPDEVDQVRRIGLPHLLSFQVMTTTSLGFFVRFCLFQLVSIYGEALKSTEEKVAELKSKRTQ
ncbi:hypothetical protein B296_00044105, partial [Ensete ventricosum]